MSACSGRCIPGGRSLRRVSDDTRLVVCEPIGDLPGAWNEVPEASYGGDREGTCQLLSFTPELPPKAR